MEIDIDYLAADKPILDRLKDKVSLVDDNKVLVAKDLAGVLESQQHERALYVVYAGDRIASSSDGRSTYGDEQIVSQQWMVVVAVRHAQGAEKDKSTAGKIILEVLRALSGWSPLDGMTEFIRVQSARPYYRKSHAHYPLMFSTNLMTE